MVNDNQSWVGFSLVAFAGILGVLLDASISNQMIYRIAYLSIGLALVLAAYSLYPSISRSRAGLGLGLFLMAASSAVIFLYWWAFSFLGRPDWFRANLYPIFVFACCAHWMACGLHLYTIGHTRERVRQYLVIMAIIMVLSILVNILGGPNPKLSLLSFTNLPLAAASDLDD